MGQVWVLTLDEWAKGTFRDLLRVGDPPSQGRRDLLTVPVMGRQIASLPDGRRRCDECLGPCGRDSNT